MDNLKVKVNNNVCELVELFIQYGCKYFNHTGSEKNYMFLKDGRAYFCKLKRSFNKSKCKEVTIDQLKDLVVLKRNDVGDANAYCADNNEHYYITSDNGYFFFLDGDSFSKWAYSSNDISYLKEHVKPIEKPMKEYINRTTGEYRKTADTVTGEQWVEVPEKWMNFAYKLPEGDIRYSDNIVSTIEQYVIWQRSEVEPTPNDKHAEIEQVRQKHSHYFKDVSHLNQIDVYDVLKLFNVTDPCLQHIIKKALCAGHRGHKDLTTDLQNIVDTAVRAVELNK